MDADRLNLLGAYLAIIILTTSCLIFISRLLRMGTAEHRIGIVFMLTALPLIYLLWTSPGLGRPVIYYVQLAIMIGFIILELLLDYVLEVGFRDITWAVIAYVMFFFAGTGGMIGIASQAGRPWAITSVVLFIVMAGLAFLQRAITGV